MDSAKFSVCLAFESGRCSTAITVKSSDTVEELLSRLRSSDRGNSSPASTEHARATFQTVREGQLELATYDGDPELMMSTLAEEERDSGIKMARGPVALLNLHHSELTGCVTHISVNSFGHIGKVKPKRGETVLQVYRRIRSLMEAAKHAVRVGVERKIKNARASLNDDDDYDELDGPLQGTESTTVLLSRHAQSRAVARKVPSSDAVRTALSPGHPMACGCIKRVITTDKGRLVAVTSHRPDRRRGPFILTLY